MSTVGLLYVLLSATVIAALVGWAVQWTDAPDRQSRSSVESYNAWAKRVSIMEHELGLHPCVRRQCGHPKCSASSGEVDEGGRL